jgi:hypothetical protein
MEKAIKRINWNEKTTQSNGRTIKKRKFLKLEIQEKSLGKSCRQCWNKLKLIYWK